MGKLIQKKSVACRRDAHFTIFVKRDLSPLFPAFFLVRGRSVHGKSFVSSLPIASRQHKSYPSHGVETCAKALHSTLAPVPGGALDDPLRALPSTLRTETQ